MPLPVSGPLSVFPALVVLASDAPEGDVISARLKGVGRPMQINVPGDRLVGALAPRARPREARPQRRRWSYRPLCNKEDPEVSLPTNGDKLW